jgi:hypothetical protein
VSEGPILKFDERKKGHVPRPHTMRVYTEPGKLIIELSAENGHGLVVTVPHPDQQFEFTADLTTADFQVVRAWAPFPDPLRLARPKRHLTGAYDPNRAKP